jgi:hypothetical protein
MTPEQRFDRLERIAKLFVRAGLRTRRNLHDMDDKLNILFDLQIQTEGKFQKNEERFAQLAESQTYTDRRLDALIDIVRQGHNGTSSRPDN